MSDAIVIVSAARTPVGGFQGTLAAATAAELGGVAIRAALERSCLPAAEVDELLMGCVLPAGQGQAPARQAGFHAGLPQDVPATTLNKMCGSGMKAVMLAHDGEAVEGDMVGPVDEHGAQALQEGCLGLARNAEDEVAAELEPAVPRHGFQRRLGGLHGMHAAQSGQLGSMEALDADAGAIESQGMVKVEPVRL
jgi:hypothetical protein